MREEMAMEARNKAGNYFKEGYNCAESVFLTFRELLAPEMDPSLVRLMTGFGGGVGQSGCMCGALTGAIVALDMVKGRTSTLESKEEAYRYAKEFSSRFEKEYQATCCRVLNPYPFKTKEQSANCLKITGNTSKMLAEFLQEKDLVK